MANDFGFIHMLAETILAGLVWILFRRQRAARRLLSALEAEQGLTKKRFEAATMGLHIRLLPVERQVRPGRDQAARVIDLPLRARPAEETPLSRGEMELVMKVRQLSRDQAMP